MRNVRLGEAGCAQSVQALVNVTEGEVIAVGAVPVQCCEAEHEQDRADRGDRESGEADGLPLPGAIPGTPGRSGLAIPVTAVRLRVVSRLVTAALSVPAGLRVPLLTRVTRLALLRIGVSAPLRLLTGLVTARARVVRTTHGERR